MAGIPIIDNIPRPSFSTRQWVVVGGAVALGVTEILSAPVALAVGAIPFIDRYVLNGGNARGTAAASRRSAGSTASRRSSGSRSTTASAARRSTSGTASGRGTRSRRGSTAGTRRRSPRRTSAATTGE